VYLSQLKLNLRSPKVQRDLINCQKLHARIMSAFPKSGGGGGARAEFGVLYRVEVEDDEAVENKYLKVLVQSRIEPAWHKVSENEARDYFAAKPKVKEVERLYAAITAGQVFSFRLRANVTRKIKTKSDPDGRRRNGNRVQLWDESRQLDWLARKAAAGGFEIVTANLNGIKSYPAAQANPGGTIKGRKEGPTGGPIPLTFGGVLFEGLLKVTDAGAFRETLAAGVGPAKAYGFGLLSVAPPP